MNAPFDIATHNGKITIVNKKTGSHRTFRISTCRKEGSFQGTRFVSMLYGQNNQTDYRAFGVVENGRVRVWKKNESEFHFTVAKMLTHPEQWLDRAEFLFEGRCRRCNRPLTNPTSIKTGLGPECAGLV